MADRDANRTNTVHTIETQQFVADRAEFVLDDERRDEWEALNGQDGQDVTGLRSFMERPSPFHDG